MESRKRNIPAHPIISERMRITWIFYVNRAWQAHFPEARGHLPGLAA
jgi:hypothetical protein